MDIVYIVRFCNGRNARRDLFAIFVLSWNSGRVVSYGICFSVEYATCKAISNGDIKARGNLFAEQIELDRPLVLKSGPDLY